MVIPASARKAVAREKQAAQDYVGVYEPALQDAVTDFDEEYEGSILDEYQGFFDNNRVQ